jgi:cephalosporin hydroxylase
MSNHSPKDPKKIAQMAADEELQASVRATFLGSCRHHYSYNFSWLGRPIIQYPQDILAIQEILWEVKPDLVIETGVAHGGSLVLSASILELIGRPAEVLGIDIEIRSHNRVEIESHPMSKRIRLIEGSSIGQPVANQVRALSKGKQRVMVFLDSNHTHDHVKQELAIYSPLVTKGSYLVVFDTVIEDMPAGSFPDRPWGKGNNPKTAVCEFLAHNSRFQLDHELESKLLLTVAPGGYLKCIGD